MMLCLTQLAFSGNTVSLLRYQHGLQRICLPNKLWQSRYTFVRSTLNPREPHLAQVGHLRMISTSPQTSTSETKTTLLKQKALTFQDAILKLQQYWVKQGCIIVNSCNSEVGAGTMNPSTFLRALGPEPWNVTYTEPSVRPDDSRYGKNPNRIQMHTQLQVLLKPVPKNPQELVLGSYEVLGIDIEKNDIRFVEDNWEHPALGAWGLGWEIWLNGMEITQFTYFQQVGGEKLDTIAVEITYGLERILMSLQNATHFKDIQYASDITYGEMYMQNEIEMSAFNMDHANTKVLSNLFDLYEKEAIALLTKGLPIPAYNLLLKASHVFNILDSRGAIGVTERASFFKRMRKLARDSAQLWVRRREELEYPLMRSTGVLKEEDTTDVSMEENGKGPATLDAEEDFALEIGVEELPPVDITSAKHQVDAQLRSLLKKWKLSFDKIEVHGTPRRLVALVTKLQTAQLDVTKRMRGPPEEIAFKDDSKLSKAGEGFLRSQGGSSPEDLEREGGYIFLTRNIPGKLASDILQKELPQIIEKLSTGRTMRWDSSGLLFPRPLRWIVAMLGDQVVPFQVGRISSGNVTRGLRSLKGEARRLRVRKAEDLKKIHEDHEIVTEEETRRNLIETHGKRLALEAGGSLVDEDANGDLMTEVVNLVENPIVIRGQFDPEFLKLPREVLITVMKKHQRYFPIADSETGSLLPYFVTVANGSTNHINVDNVRRDNEAVLRARYSDAAFFYQKDTERDFTEFIPLLSGIMFQEKLGSMLEKTKRLERTSILFAKMLGLSDEDTDFALQGARLCKADLATQMVVEMTSLAGIMGKHYAKLSKHIPSKVADIIFETALPRFAGDELAKSLPGIVVALADRFDSLMGLCSVGILPKSTSDPFAMRRAALGIVSTLIENQISMNIETAAKTAGDEIDAQQNNGNGHAATRNENVSAVTDFIKKRLCIWFLENDYRSDVVHAVLSEEKCGKDPFYAYTLVNDLQDCFENDFENLDTAVEVYNRAVRFLKGIKDMDSNLLVKTELFESDIELDLHEALCSAEDFLKNEKGIRPVLNTLVRIKKEVDNFFDGVFINSENERLRQNRIALCRRIVALPMGVANLQALQMTPSM